MNQVGKLVAPKDMRVEPANKHEDALEDVNTLFAPDQHALANVANEIFNQYLLPR